MSFSKLISFGHLMRLNKPVGILLLLWPTLWALWFASVGHPPLMLMAVFTLGTILMRSAGCIMNDMADRHFDGHVARTKNRPLVTGAVTLKQAIILFITLCLLSASLLLFLNVKVFYLAIVGVLLTVVYPFCKRFIKTPQLVLGLAFSWGIPMAFAATLNTLPFETVLLMSLTFAWIVVYDTMYAMADKEDDLLIGIQSTAIYFGQYDRVIIYLLQGFMAFIWLLLAYRFQLNQTFYTCWLFGLGLCVYQQYLIKDRDPQYCFKAFLNNQWYGLVMMLGLLLGFSNYSA